MALTVSEASAVFDLLHWLGCPVRPSEQLVDDERAAAALALLADHAGHTLHINVQPGEARQAIERVAAERSGEVRSCRYCGCTDDRACPGGCSWTGQDVCSACAWRARELEGQLTLGDVTS